MMQPSAYMKRGVSILLVDDSEENLKLLADTLMREGYRVRPARSGRMALESAKRRPPDLVLLDIRMPEMDGFEVCRQLKSDPCTADVPVIFISAVEELGDKIKAFDTGGVDYITKPFQEREILSRVKTHLMLYTMHQNLEALVRQRTEELEKTNRALLDSERQLRQAQKMEALGTLASGIAHDFNNILYPIIGYSELALAHTEAESANHRRLNEILGCAKHANELVNQILAFSRQSKPELRTLLLPPIIEEIVEPFRAFLPRAIALRLKLDRRCGFVRADPAHIHQIVSNLMTNATHAMEESGGTLTISLHQETLGPHDLLHEEMHPGAHVCLCVADTGAGIDPAVMDKLFDPYFTTKEKGKGTGLGLAVVHGIVTGYGGGVRVSSTKGKGARFDICLPVSEQNGAADVKAAVEILPKGSERILVVDDEPQSMNLLHESLSLLGYNVIRHDSGVSALAAFRAAPHRYDLVLTDYAMPEMSGAQLAEALLAIRPEIPIILCSGHSEPFSDENAAAIGIREFLKKPLLRDSLARVVRSTLDTPVIEVSRFAR